MSGYRQRRDPHEIAVELYTEAMDRQTQALKAKHAAEAALQRCEHEHEVLLAKHGMHASTVRHLSAVLSASALAGRGAADSGQAASLLAGAQAQMDATGQQIAESEKRIEAARGDLGQAVDALALATREVTARRAELERL